jgi:hypothetical protein
MIHHLNITSVYPSSTHSSLCLLGLVNIIILKSNNITYIHSIITFIILKIDVTETSLISQVLLANADALCAPAVPLMDPDETLL